MHEIAADQAAILALLRNAGLLSTGEPAALADGHLRGASLDVFDREPIDESNPPLALPNLIATPHVAWLTPETLARSLAVAAENFARLEAGQPLLNRVA